MKPPQPIDIYPYGGHWFKITFEDGSHEITKQKKFNFVVDVDIKRIPTNGQASHLYTSQKYYSMRMASGRCGNCRHYLDGLKRCSFRKSNGWEYDSRCSLYKMERKTQKSLVFGM